FPKYNNVTFKIYHSITSFKSLYVNKLVSGTEAQLVSGTEAHDLNFSDGLNLAA
ncbi:MAG: hypothetical protein PWP62_1087, partial [Eubacteriaceae bacterium]|nr:hypothetical protein [Eubacteriaceae bacterium]